MTLAKNITPSPNFEDIYKDQQHRIYVGMKRQLSQVSKL